MNEKFPLALPEGTVLAGQYIIEKALGQGGFGITYKAKDYKTGESVAVKEFFPEAMATRSNTTVMPFTGERGESYEYGKSCFLQEAETLAQFIGTENIVRIHSYFEENGTAYFVMDFIEGISFDEYIKNNGGKVSYEVAESILIKVIEALAVVHSKGIVHRDVTPDNIYITKDGVVKLLDFGAARYSIGDKSRSLDVVLKHGFAPKEQYTRHGKQGPFTDVYTVGASFYFAITGKRPPDSIDRIEEDDLVPPSRLGVQIPEAKENAILTAMSVQPGDRFKTMDEFKNALLYGNQQVNTVPANGYEQQSFYQQPNPQSYNQQVTHSQYNQQYDAYMYGNQDAGVYQAATYVEQKPKSKKWLIPVIAGVAVLGIVGGVILLGGDKKDDEKTSEKYTYESEEEKDDYDLPKTTESLEEKTTEAVVEDIEDTESVADSTCVSVEGYFDTYNTNNQMNDGYIFLADSGIAYSTGASINFFNNSTNEFTKIDSSSSYYCGVNMISENEIIYINGNGEVYTCKTDGSNKKKLDMFDSFGDIESIIANEEGAFFTYLDTTGNYILNYINWDGYMTKCYYYVYDPNCISIIDNYIYWVDNDGIYRLSLSSFGTENGELVCRIDDFYPSAMIGEGDYLYIYNNEKIGRINVNTGDFILATAIVSGETINGLTVYNGVLYYTVYYSNDNCSRIWSIYTDSSGWSENDYYAVWESEANGYTAWSPAYAGDLLWTPMYDVNSGKKYGVYVNINTGELTFFE